MSIKVALFIDNHSMGDVDISKIYQGNPGIGGTQYEMFLLAKLMFDHCKSFDFVLLLTNCQKGFDKPKVVVLEKFDDVFDYCNNEKIDILISRENNRFDKINGLLTTKVIFWIHNFISYNAVKRIGETNNIKRVIFVSKQHYDYYLEYNVNNKATFIYNSLALPGQIPAIDKKDNIVVFAGNIVPIKRLHLVTKIWPFIIKKVPDARLFVIGTGASAHRDVLLGPYNLASPAYEKQIMEPLIKNNIVDSVEFFGVLGVEKNKIIRKAKVGVCPNKDETFCLAAAEYNLNGVPVVGVAKGGLNDVVINGKTGLLNRSLCKIKKNIVKILKGQKKLVIDSHSLAQMDRKFGFNSFLNAWIKNIDEVANNEKVVFLKPSRPLCDKMKLFGSFFRFLRRTFHLPECFSRLGLYRLVKRNR